MNSTQTFQCSDILFSMYTQANASSTWHGFLLFPEVLHTSWFNYNNFICPSHGLQFCAILGDDDHRTGLTAAVDVVSLHIGAHSLGLYGTNLWLHNFRFCSRAWLFILGKKSHLSLCHESHSGKSRCTVKISFNSYNLKLHKAKSDNPKM